MGLRQAVQGRGPYLRAEPISSSKVGSVVVEIVAQLLFTLLQVHDHLQVVQLLSPAEVVHGIDEGLLSHGNDLFTDVFDDIVFELLVFVFLFFILFLASSLIEIASTGGVLATGELA